MPTRKARIWSEYIPYIKDDLRRMYLENNFGKRVWWFFDEKYWANAPSFDLLLQAIKEYTPYAHKS